MDKIKSVFGAVKEGFATFSLMPDATAHKTHSNAAIDITTSSWNMTGNTLKTTIAKVGASIVSRNQSRRNGLGTTGGANR